MTTTKSTISTVGLTTFGARLRHTRDEQGLSRTALAKLTNKVISPRVIDHLESGTTDVTAQRVEALSSALNIDRNWLMFGDPLDTEDQTGSPAGETAGEPVIQPVDLLVVTPVSPVNEPQNTPKRAIERPEKALSSAFKRHKALDAPEKKNTRPSAPAATEMNRPNNDVTENDVIIQFPNLMRTLLSQIDHLRRDGLQNHPRKLPKLLARAVDIGECLEQSDLQELAQERKIRTTNPALESDTKEEFDEFVLRLVDTSLLGIDLYEVEIDTLSSFARRQDVSSPFFGWKNHAEIVPSVRNAYWGKALEGGISLTASLRQAT